MPWIIPGIIISYFVGSIPTAYIFGRILKGVDIRQFGSGNIGATNALRVLGRIPGIAVLIFDMLKGLISVLLIGDFLAARVALSDEAIRVLLGLSCIAGHIWTVFLRFKGGKGVATTFGVLLGLSLKVPGLAWVFGPVILIWLAVFMLLRIVSLASIISILALPLLMLLFKKSAILVVSSLLLAILILIRHRSNLKRILQGKESRLRFK
jgi:glycerol-3-phosphate acyltransferase PlsY